MKQHRKRTSRVRNRDWETQHEQSFSHDLKKHLRTNTPIVHVAAAQSSDKVPDDFEPNGLVVSHSKKWAFVWWNDKEHLCRISDALIERDSTILAAGDEVLVEQIEDGEPTVRAVKPRRTRLSRHAIEDSRVSEQVIAANVDLLLIIVAAAKPAFKPGLVDRYLICAEAGGVEPILCINKMDLVEGAPGDVDIYRALGVPVILTSCSDGRGVEELRTRLLGKIAVLAGQSGVGKSSLLNVLDPGLDLATREVSTSNEKGKHTTTSSRLYRLDGDITLIDTPGVRQLGIWKVTFQELAFYFPEIAEHAAGCRFRDCTHSSEPGCAVRAGVESGDIPERRFLSYLRIRSSIEDRGAPRR